MSITHKFTATLPPPTSSIFDNYVFLVKTSWFTAANQGVAGSPVDGGMNSFTNGGGDLQVFSDEECTQRVGVDVVSFSTGVSPDIEVWVRLTQYTTGTTLTFAKVDNQTVQPLPSAPYGANSVWLDTISHYHLNEVPSTSSQGYIDSAGNNHATGNGSIQRQLVGSRYWAEGDGVGAYIDTGILTSSSIKGMSFWVIPHSVSSTTRTGYAGSDGRCGIYYGSSSGSTYVGGRYGSTNVVDNTPVVVNEEHLLSFSYDGDGTLRVYANGLLIAEDVAEGITPPDMGVSGLTLLATKEGNGTTNSYLDGLIRDVTIWDRTRDADEQATAYSQQKFSSSTSTEWISTEPLAITSDSTYINTTSLTPVLEIIKLSNSLTRRGFGGTIGNVVTTGYSISGQQPPLGVFPTNGHTETNALVPASVEFTSEVIAAPITPSVSVDMPYPIVVLASVQNIVPAVVSTISEAVAPTIITATNLPISPISVGMTVGGLSPEVKLTGILEITQETVGGIVGGLRPTISTTSAVSLLPSITAVAVTEPRPAVVFSTPVVVQASTGNITFNSLFPEVAVTSTLTVEGEVSTLVSEASSPNIVFTVPTSITPDLVSITTYTTQPVVELTTEVVLAPITPLIFVEILTPQVGLGSVLNVTPVLCSSVQETQTPIVTLTTTRDIQATVTTVGWSAPRAGIVLSYGTQIHSVTTEVTLAVQPPTISFGSAIYIDSFTLGYVENQMFVSYAPDIISIKYKK